MAFVLFRELQVVSHRFSPQFTTAWLVPSSVRHLFLQLRVAQTSVPLLFLATPVLLEAGGAYLGGVRVMRPGCLSPLLLVVIVLHRPEASVAVMTHLEHPKELAGVWPLGRHSLPLAQRH